MRQYKLQAGETFQKLADRLKIPVDAIVRANPGINPSKLQINQEINLPDEADLKTEISDVVTTDVITIEGLDKAIISAAQRAGVRPDILKGLVSVESKGDPEAGSSAGAKGLTQIMDPTGVSLGVTNPHDIGQNLAAGAMALKRYYAEAGSLKFQSRWAGLGFDKQWELALMIYHAGAPAVQAWLSANAPTDLASLLPKQLAALKGFGKHTLAYPAKVIAAIKSPDPFPGFRLYIKRKKDVSKDN